MNKIFDWMKNLGSKYKSLSKGVRMSIITLSICGVVALGCLGFYLTRTDYGVLFANMSTKDSGNIINKLKEQKIEYKISDNKIMVEKSKVDDLRLSLLSEVKLEDNTSPFDLIIGSGSMVSTEFENNIKFKVALQEEISRTIEAFNEIKKARVGLNIPEQSGFAREPLPASAGIHITLEDGVEQLKENQVKAITMLVSKSVANLPEKNIAIAVNNMLLVTDNKDNNEELFSSDEQDQIVRAKERSYENKILNLLKSTFGEEGVRVAVNIDMNFDVIKTESVDYKEGYVVSEKNSVNSSSSGSNGSSSPVDDNMSNTEAADGESTTNTSQSQTKNYNVPEVRETKVESPGKVNKVSVSVLVDKSLGIMDADTKKQIENHVAAVVGFNPERGDAISVGSLSFMNKKKEILETTRKNYLAEQEALKKEQMVKSIGFGIVGLILLLTMLSILRKMKKQKKQKEMKEIEEMMAKEIEVDENGDLIDKVKEFAPIDFDVESEQEHMTKEVKKYAQEKPEQVVEIIKSWLAEDERG